MSSRRSTLSLNQKLTLFIAFLAVIVAIVTAFISGHDWFTQPLPTSTQLPSDTSVPIQQSPTLYIAPSDIATETETAIYVSVPTILSTTPPLPAATETSTPMVVFDRNNPMIVIPWGVFEMYGLSGTSQVYLNRFLIDRHEVTNGEYRKCVDANACLPPYTDADKKFGNVVHYGDTTYDNYPVVLVDWNMAQNYCRWRSPDTRLPTEAEWERAARGTLSAQSYPWGDLSPVCSLEAVNGSNFQDCNSNDTFPVESYSPNGFGIYDMAGNVAEWVDEDMGDNSKTIRGGSWYDDATQLTVFSTIKGEILSGYVNVGFRCAKSLP